MGQREIAPGPEEVKRAVSEYSRRAFSHKERPEMEAMLFELVTKGILPLRLLEEIPAPPGKVGKTRFDQIYDAVMALVFPGYAEDTLRSLLGPDHGTDVKVWRVMFPPKFGLTHVLIRASSFQEAFALGCDYACRMSLKMERSIPTDLTMRVAFVSERGIRRMLQLRWYNKAAKRDKLKLVGRTYSSKEVTGARICALGRPEDRGFSIFKYVEAQDLRKILKERDELRLSAVENELFRKP